MDSIRITAPEVRRLVRRQLPALRRRCAGFYEREFFGRLLDATLAEVDAVATVVPPLSSDSPFRFHITAAAAMFAMERGMEAMGLAREEALERMRAMGERYYLGMPRIAGFFVRRKLFSKGYQRSLAAYAQASSGRRPEEGDWLFSIEPGDGESKPLVMDFSRCGIKALSERLGRPDLCAPMCSFDFAMAKSFGYSMARTGTLGTGKAVCDFVYRRN